MITIGGQNIDGSTLVAGSAVIVSLISTFVALRSSFRANKVAERQINTLSELEIIKLREKWIEQVREEMSKLIFLSSMPLKSYSFSLDERSDKWVQAFTKILLLLPHEDKTTEAFVAKLSEMRADQLSDNCNGETPADVILLGKEILKNEWDQLVTDIEKVRTNNA